MSFHLKFLGAAGSVTGSKFILRTKEESLLTEFGLVQGHRKQAFEENSAVSPDALKTGAMVLSHAHLDHSGNIPRLVSHGYKKPIYATGGTIDLVKIMLLDSAEIGMRDIEYVNKKNLKRGDPLVEPLYTVEEAQASFENFRALEYHANSGILPGFTATFYDAGHILGAAQILYEVEGHRVLFTGDLGRPLLPVVRDPEHVPSPDVIICESTYGNRVHKPLAEAKERLADILGRACDRNAKILVPAFAVGRTQALVLVMHQLMDEGRLPAMPVWVDSPLSLEATQIFERHPECFDAETAEFLKKKEDPFGFSRLRYVKTVEESKALNEIKGPCVIIASSGMCEGGRVVHHLKNTITDPNNLVLITGYQAQGTLGRRIVEKVEVVRLFGEEFPLNCEVKVLNEYSAHADKNDLLNFFKNYDPGKVKQVFLVHGEADQSEALSLALAELGYSYVTIPQVGQDYEIP